MSSRANGCMIVILPKDKVKDFEGYFDAQNDYAFINTEIELAESVDSDIVGYERRVYDVSCCYSLESCLIEPRDNNIQDVCYNLGLQYEITTPKNITSNRKVWMTELVVKTLKDLRAESERDYDFAETDFVFGGKLPLSDQTVRRRMDQYADKAGIKRIRIHDLRHSHASLVISKGLKIEDLILLSKRLGHRDVKETLNTYSHLFPNAQRKILESIDEGAEM